MISKAPWLTLRVFGLPFSIKLDRRVPLIGVFVIAFVLSTLIASMSYGEYNISIGQVVKTLLKLNTDHPDYANYHLVVYSFRLPRSILAFLVGAALATSGTILQGITRNSLAEPRILGITSGAGLAAVLIITRVENVPIRYLPWAAFGGGLMTALLVYGLSWSRGKSSPLRMVLVGIAIGAGLEACTTLLLTFADVNDVQQAYTWLAGSVYGRNWEHVYTLGGWMSIFMPLAWFLSRQLNAINLGDESAKGLGMNVEGQRRLLLLTSVALASSAVAVAGTISFVGLLAPHIVRRLVGPAHEGLIPLAALYGGALLMMADLVGRWVIAPSEMPVGVVTGIIGAPYFLFLLYRYRKEL